MRSSVKSIKVPSITPLYKKILTQSRVWRSAFDSVIASFCCVAIWFYLCRQSKLQTATPLMLW